MINVTRTFLPPFGEYTEYLKRLWESKYITNNGSFVQELEQTLKDFLNVEHLFFVNNGTVALQIAIKALGLKGEVITTPFSYVATTSSIVWENCKPVFADIDPFTLNVAVENIEPLITDKTSAILVTHVYGNACEVEAIQSLAEERGLKVIYDAAHAFNTGWKGQSILNWGDISTLSFHATKLFHTVEGGAIVTDNDDIAHKINYLRNFGHRGPEDFWGVGINAKNSELHAAMGLAIYPYLEEILSKRKNQWLYYSYALSELPVQQILVSSSCNYNYSYFPIVLNSEKTLLHLTEELSKEGIMPRRYFYPSLNKLSYIKGQKCSVSEDMSQRVLCLPLYHDLQEVEQQMICDLISRILIEGTAKRISKRKLK